jgi:hypothetical protein
MPDEKNELRHNVFISWSGNRSRHVARALRDWLPMVIQAARPFMSKADIDKGSRWHIELASALEVTKVGIICLTPENSSAPWLLFESGALSKTIDRGTRVCTYLLAGLQPQQVVPPLGDFQATKAEKDETRQMLQDVNKALGLPISEQTLNDVFDLAWPKLDAALTSMPKPETAVPPKRSLEDMVAEILELSRAAAKRRSEAESVAKLGQELSALYADTKPSAADTLRAALAELSGKAREGGVDAYLVNKSKGEDATPNRTEAGRSMVAEREGSTTRE